MITSCAPLKACETKMGIYGASSGKSFVPPCTGKKCRRENGARDAFLKWRPPNKSKVMKRVHATVGILRLRPDAGRFKSCQTSNVKLSYMSCLKPREQTNWITLSGFPHPLRRAISVCERAREYSNSAASPLSTLDFLATAIGDAFLHFFLAVINPRLKRSISGAW